jgi:polysaccharide pyruvyl transferase WcaK-like protein
VACSSRGDDESVIPDILERLDSGIRENLREQIYFPKIGTWKDLVSVLHNADYMIASRLHGTIFGFLTETPVVAISFALKADWIIEYLRQSDYRLDIRDFSAHEVLETLNCIKLNRNAVVNQIASHRKEVLADAASARQYSLLARLALEHRRSRN